MHQVSLQEAAAHLPELIKEASHGEEVVITDDNQPVAKLVSVKASSPKPRRGSAKGMILYMAEDFDAPLDEFAEYM